MTIPLSFPLSLFPSPQREDLEKGKNKESEKRKKERNKRRACLYRTRDLPVRGSCWVFRCTLFLSVNTRKTCLSKAHHNYFTAVIIQKIHKCIKMKLTSTIDASEEVLIMRPTTYFFIPAKHRNILEKSMAPVWQYQKKVQLVPEIIGQLSKIRIHISHKAARSTASMVKQSFQSK